MRKRVFVDNRFKLFARPLLRYALLFFELLEPRDAAPRHDISHNERIPRSMMTIVTPRAKEYEVVGVEPQRSALRLLDEMVHHIVYVPATLTMRERVFITIPVLK